MLPTWFCGRAGRRPSIQLLTPLYKYIYIITNVSVIITRQSKKVNWICQSEFIKANSYHILMSHIHKVTFAPHDHILSFQLTMLSKKEK